MNAAMKRTALAGLSVLLACVATTPFALARKKAEEKKEPAPVAIVGGVAISSDQLEQQVAPRLAPLKTQEYEIRRQGLDELIARALLDGEARGRGISADELKKTEIDEKAPQVSEDEVKTFYEQNKARLGNRSEQEALAMIRDGMGQGKTAQRTAEFLAELRLKAGVKVLLEAPRIAVDAGDDPFRGPENAPVTIVEFSDYQCPFCGRAEGALKQVKERYGDTVRIVFRDFPLQMHQFAAKASEAADCANEQGKFWEMHDRMFGDQGKLSLMDLKSAAKDLGLKEDDFNSCLDSGKYAKEVSGDLADGERYGVTGTPAFFVNGRSLSGAQPFDTFAVVIEEELERAGVAVPPAKPAEAAGPEAKEQAKKPAGE